MNTLHGLPWTAAFKKNTNKMCHVSPVSIVTSGPITTLGPICTSSAILADGS